MTVTQPDGSEVAVPRLGRFRQLIDEAMAALRTEAFKSLEAEIKRSALRQLGFDPETDTDKLDFFFRPFDTMDFYKALDLYVREAGVPVRAIDLGEGVQNAIVLAILQVFEQRRKQGAIILIEEPEMFLHPQMQRALYGTLRSIGATNQVLYTTHSPHFVSIPEYQEIVLVRKNSEGTRVVRSSLPTDPKRREKLIKELDAERNEFFFASRLLLVEGDTEKLALPEYARHLGFDLDRESASIVEVGGKRNLPSSPRLPSLSAFRPASSTTRTPPTSVTTSRTSRPSTPSLTPWPKLTAPFGSGSCRRPTKTSCDASSASRSTRSCVRSIRR